MKKPALLLSSLMAVIMVITTAFTAVNIQVTADPSHPALTSQPGLTTTQPYAPGVVLVGLNPQLGLRDAIRDQDTIDQVLPQLSTQLKAIGVLSIESLFPPTHGITINSTEALHQQDTTLRLQLPENADIQAVVALLKAEPSVAYAEPDYLAEFAGAPNDPRYNEQWGLAQVNVEAAWTQTTGSSNVVIAVIDSGLDLDHEDLAPNLWENPGEIPDNGIDDDNNGFIDDVWGWNFVDKNNNVQDFVGHGSLVAGVAAARSGNGLGIAGVCGECQIMPVKVSQISGVANYSDIAAGVNYAVGKGARVINLSLGGYAISTTLQNAINYALEQNVVVVAGAGNDNKSDPFYPAAFPGVISVAGTDPNDAKTSSSNYGSWVDLTAPGEDILSTTLDGYSTGSGTSYAAPFVSGAAGLLLSLNPDWTPAMVRSQFLNTADDISGQNPAHQGMLGAGRLNVGASMQTPKPILTYAGYAGNGTPNLRPEFPSTVSLTVTVGNTWADAVNVSGTLTSSDPHVTVTQGTASFGTILAGESKANTTAFNFNIASTAGYNHSMPFNLVLTANNGAYQTTLSFQILTRSRVENVSGTISSDTTWTGDKTYRVTGNVGIAPGYTLTIEPGTTVQFSGNYSLNIGGTLVARGTPANPIIFEHETTGETWYRVFFDTSSEDAQVTEAGIYQSGNVLEHVRLHGAADGIACNSATPYLNHVKTDQGGMACSLGATNLWMVDTDLTGAVNITQGGAEPETLIRVAVSNGDTSLPAASVTDSTFSESLTINGAGQVSDTHLRSLTISGVGEVKFVTATGLIQVGINSTVEDSTLLGGRISAGGDSTIIRNNIEDAPAAGIALSGSGTVTYNRVVGGSKGIVVGGGTVENNLVAYTSGNGLEPGTAAVRHNTLIGIEGHAVYLAQVPAAFEFNNFEFNTGDYDVYLDVPNSVQPNVAAQNNWWGTTDQDLIKARVYDFDQDYNLARLITTLPLTEPSQTAPGYVRAVTLDPASPVGIQTVAFTVEFSRPMGGDEDPVLSIESTKTNSWTTKASMITARSQLGVAAASNGQIYAIGGLEYYFSLTNKVEAYDPLTDTWSSVTPMPTARYSFGVAAASDGRIYAIGGSTSSGPTNIVEAYDPFTDTWLTMAPMPTPRSYLGVTAASDGLIYAIGGIDGPDGSYKTNIVEAYNPLTNTWVTKTSMPTPRYHLDVTATKNGKIFAISGYDNTRDIEEYDIFTDSWISKKPMTIEPTLPNVVAADNGNIFLMGGSRGGGYYNHVYEYNPDDDSFLERSPMTTKRYRMGIEKALDGKIYAIGGQVDSSQITSSVEEYTPPLWGRKEISNHQIWLTDTNFSAQFDFTILNPRGDYRIIVDGITDPDGILIAPDSRTTFIVDYAGEIGDPTPPPTPQVLAWGNGGLTQLTARAYAQDPDSVITGYRYAIGSTPGGTDVVNWTNTNQTQVIRTGLQLQPGQAYYISFQSRSAGGIWSNAGVSNAVVDGSQLPAPVLTGLDPESAVAGGGGFTLTVTGEYFIEEAVVRWNGGYRPTTFVSPNKLEAEISAGDISSIGERTITIYIPSPGGGTSNGMTFTITTAPTPTPDPTDTPTPVPTVVPTPTPTPTPTPEVSDTIDEKGGTVTFDYGKIKIDVPKGALEAETRFTYLPQSSPSHSIGQFSFSGISFQLTAQKVASGDPVTTFDPPLEVTIHYDPETLGNISEDSLRLYYWDGAAWRDVLTTCVVGEYTRNLAQHWFSVPVCHLSEFAVLSDQAGYRIFLPLITR